MTKTFRDTTLARASGCGIPRGESPRPAGRAGCDGGPVKLKLDLHDVYNRGDEIERALRRVIDEAVRTKAPLVEIIPGKALGPAEEAGAAVPRPQGDQGGVPPGREGLGQPRPDLRALPVEVTSAWRESFQSWSTGSEGPGGCMRGRWCAPSPRRRDRGTPARSRRRLRAPAGLGHGVRAAVAMVLRRSQESRKIQPADSPRPAAFLSGQSSKMAPPSSTATRRTTRRIRR